MISPEKRAEEVTEMLNDLASSVGAVADLIHTDPTGSFSPQGCKDLHTEIHKLLSAAILYSSVILLTDIRVPKGPKRE